MRRVGGNLTEEQADRLSQYLYTEEIQTAVEKSPDGTYELWARDEDQLVRSREELAAFLKDPGAERYRVDRKAEALRRKEEKEKRERLRLQKQFKPRGGPGMGPLGAAGPARATMGIIAICVGLSLVTRFGDVTRGDLYRAQGEPPMSSQIFNALTLLPTPQVPPDAGPLWAVTQGEVWRLITPLFLHGSIMHLLLNCLFIFSFGRIVEMLFGPAFMLALFLIGGVVGLFAQAYGPAWMGGSPQGIVIGASGGALALFAFLWLRPTREPTLPFRMSPFNVVFILGFVVLSILPTGLFTNVANLAHLGGLVTGAIAAAGAIDFLRR